MNIEELKRKLEEEAEREHIPILRKEERALLLKAADMIRPRRILEIGTAIGYSALLLAEHFPEAAIDTLEIDETRYRRALSVMKEAGFDGPVRCLLGDAEKLIPRLKGPYDFLYLDGPKGQYLNHLKQAEPLLSEKAVIAADNVLFRGLVRTADPVPHRYRTIVLRLREYISYVEKNYRTMIYEEGDGLAVSVKYNREG